MYVYICLYVCTVCMYVGSYVCGQSYGRQYKLPCMLGMLCGRVFISVA